MPAPSILDAFDGTLRGPDHRDLHVGALREQGTQAVGRIHREPHRFLLARAAEDDVHESCRRRVGWYAPALQLLLHEAAVVVIDRAADGMVRGFTRLDEDFPTLRAATGASGDLTQELKASL